MAGQYNVTSVGVNPAADRAQRMRMYFLAMSLRVACIVSLFWVRGYWIILAAAGAVILPYVAVLIANAVSHTGGATPSAPPPLQLTTQEPEAADERPHPSQVVIVVDEPAERRAQGSGESS